jgi:hypothetical protein
VWHGSRVTDATCVLQERPPELDLEAVAAVEQRERMKLQELINDRKSRTLLGRAVSVVSKATSRMSQVSGARSRTTRYA